MTHVGSSTLKVQTAGTNSLPTMNLATISNSYMDVS